MGQSRCLSSPRLSLRCWGRRGLSNSGVWGKSEGKSWRREAITVSDPLEPRYSTAFPVISHPVLYRISSAHLALRLPQLSPQFPLLPPHFFASADICPVVGQVPDSDYSCLFSTFEESRSNDQTFTIDSLSLAHSSVFEEQYKSTLTELPILIIMTGAPVQAWRCSSPVPLDWMHITSSCPRVETPSNGPGKGF
jgi:hypothetical protein